MAQRKAQRRKPRGAKAAKTMSRPERAEGPPPAMAKPRRTSSGRTLDAAVDRIAIRDPFYQPSFIALPDQLVSVHQVPLILDQGQRRLHRICACCRHRRPVVIAAPPLPISLASSQRPSTATP